MFFRNLPVMKYYSPSTLFADQSGTSTTAADVGSAVKTTSLGTTPTKINGTSISWKVSNFPELVERNLSLIGRITDAATGKYLRIGANVIGSTANDTYSGYSRPYAMASAVMLLYITPKFSVSYSSEISPEYIGDKTIYVNLYGYRNTGTDNILVDYIALFPSPCLIVNQPKTGAAISTFAIKGDRAVGDEVGGTFRGEYTAIGDILEFSPNRYNILQSLMTFELSADEPSPDISDITDAITYTIYVTPRYLLV